MKAPKRTYHLKVFAPALFFISYGLISCSDKYVVLSSDHAMNTKTSKVYRMEIDSTLEIYDIFRLTDEELEESRILVRRTDTQKDQ